MAAIRTVMTEEIRAAENDDDGDFMPITIEPTFVSTPIPVASHEVANPVGEIKGLVANPSHENCELVANLASESCALVANPDKTKVVLSENLNQGKVANLDAQKGGLQPSMQPVCNRDWLTMEQTCELLSISRQAIQKNISKGKYQARKVVSEKGGRGGMRWEIAAESLPEPFRSRWYQSLPTVEIEPPTHLLAVTQPQGQFLSASDYERKMKRALWIEGVIKPIFDAPPCSAERTALLKKAISETTRDWDHSEIKLVQGTVYQWLKSYENGGIAALMHKERVDRGEKRILVSRKWDKAFIGLISIERAEAIGGELKQYIASLWAEGAPGERRIMLFSQNKLIDMTTQALEESGMAIPSSLTAFCIVSLGEIRKLRDDFKILAIQRFDAKEYFDKYQPRIRRDWSSYMPNDIWIGDVHPVDIRMLREDGKEVYARAICWLDVATMRIFTVLIRLEKNEGVKRWHIAQSFIAAVKAMGLPRRLYLDNGSEYKWTEMLNAFNDISKFGATCSVYLGIPDDLKGLDAKENNVIRALPYNAPAKVIEQVFGNLEENYFSMAKGHVGGDRTNKKLTKVGGTPHTYDEDWDAFHTTVATFVETYHKTPQKGIILQNQSPVQRFNEFVSQGWKAITINENSLMLAMAEPMTRKVWQGGYIEYKPRYAPMKIAYQNPQLADLVETQVEIRTLPYELDFIFVFHKNQNTWLTVDLWKSYGALDQRGILALKEAKKHYQRVLSEKRGLVVRLNLEEEARAWNARQEDFVETPIAATIEASATVQALQIAYENRAIERETTPQITKQPKEQRYDRFGLLDEDEDITFEK